MDAVGYSPLNIKAIATEWFERYRQWIVKNPNLLSDIESTIKYASFFTAGRLNSSNFASELIYSLPNLIILFNDHLMRLHLNPSLKIPSLQNKLKVWLTIIDYTEALFELTSKKIYGEVGRWCVILFIQFVKVMMRLLLVFRFKEGILPTPPIQPLNREKLYESEDVDFTKEAFKLKRSGKVIRTVRSSSCQPRTWKPPGSPEFKSNEPLNGGNLRLLKKSVMIAETLYIIKPLLHLGCLSVSGRRNWNPWLLSFIIDLASLKLYNQETDLTREEREEICRRRIGLLLYLLRSPFYDKCSRMRIYAFLEIMSKTVPLAKLITEPVARYLPHWQNTYFYMWSS